MQGSIIARLLEKDERVQKMPGIAGHSRLFSLMESFFLADVMYVQAVFGQGAFHALRHGDVVG